MTSSYRRDHILSVKNDEFERLNLTARTNINTVVTALAAMYPTPIADSGETVALRRACARYLIDSGKASIAGAY